MLWKKMENWLCHNQAQYNWGVYIIGLLKINSFSESPRYKNHRITEEPGGFMFSFLPLPYIYIYIYGY